MSLVCSWKPQNNQQPCGFFANARAWISVAELLSTDLLGQKAPRFDGQ